MANKTIKMTAEDLIGDTNLLLRLHRRGRGAILNGTGTSATIDGNGEITAVVTEAIAYPDEVLEVTIIDSVTSDRLWNRDSNSLVYIPVDAEGTYYVSAQALSELQLAKAKNLQAVTRSTEDTTAIEFTWPVAGDSAGSANIGGSAGFTTKTRRFKPLATTESVSGAITFVGTINGENWWKLAYNINDRADDGTTVVPAEIEYALVDNAGRAGQFTLVIVSAVVASEDKVAY